MTDATLGQRIAERRKLLGLSQEALGEKMGVSRQAISKWEADATTPEIEKLIAMSRLFDVSVGWLLGTEENEQDLSAKIKIAFQPPKSAPVPTETPPPPAPEREEPPKQAIPHWLMIGFAAITLLSLILSIFSLVKLNNQPQPTVSETVATEGPRVEALEKKLTELSDLLKELEENSSIASHRIDSLSREYQALLEQIGTGTKPPETPAQLPSYDSLTQWSLTGDVATDITKVTVTFKATASVALTSAQLSVQKSGEQFAFKNCFKAGPSIMTTLEIPAADGYQYTLTLNHANGTNERITLTGHGLSDLTALAQPQQRSTARPVNLMPERLQFYQSWFNIYLEIPYLASPGAAYQWSQIRIGYYHNDVFVSSEDMSKFLSESPLDTTSLSFAAKGASFDMHSLEDGHTHDLRLEGTLTIDGVENEFSLPLIGWVVRDGQFVEITN